MKLDIPEMSLGLANCRVVVSDTFAEALQKESVFETYAGGKIPVFAVVPSTVLDMLVKEKAETPLEIDEANKKDQLTILISPRIEGGQLVCGILHDEHLRIAYGGRKEVLLEKEQLQGFLRNLLTVVQNGIVDNLGSRASWCSRLLDRVATPYPLDARVLHENTRWMLNDLDFR
ncbi:MAG TPA: hypothetical protein PK992_13480, partial [Planctomycetaceae bacterium]|nr:hypothetical protein [Planctomycetaceae bacterium]